MTETLTEQVAKAVEEGLFRKNKFLPSWLFYDEQGDKIFQQIMRMPEYYLTRAEYEILDKNKEDIFHRFYHPHGFRLVELGAGDGLKTEILLKHFARKGTNFSYHPVDISASVLDQLHRRLEESVPNLSIHPVQGEYQAVLSSFMQSGQRDIILFLGSNLGNFPREDAASFLQSIAAVMKADDLLFLGLDLKKDPEIIRLAYDDPHCITRNFNLNLLTRLNREIGADFNVDRFRHIATYDADTGEAKSYLESSADQSIFFSSLEATLHLKKGERIYTEISMKYDSSSLDALLRAAGLEIAHQYFDSRSYFTNLVLTRKANE